MKHNMYGQVILALLLLGCQLAPQKNQSLSTFATDYDFPNPVNTTGGDIFEQTKRSYNFDDIQIDNEFDAARLNSVEQRNDTLLLINILPENEPINISPWYAFRLSSTNRSKIYIELNYEKYKHRYAPKISIDRKNWTTVDPTGSFYNSDSTSYTFCVELDKNPVYVSAQEIFTSGDLINWASVLATSPFVKQGIAGKSVMNRDLHVLDIYKGSKKGKKLLVIFSRQHPPEVTGFFAMQAFIESIVSQGDSLGFLKDYRVLVYPMLNPDGVDLGHWRHNANGVDLNRDWAYYNQPETRQIADHVVREVNENQNIVVLGVDFHSTYNDVFYTQDKEELKTPTTNWFRDQWFNRIKRKIPDYKINEKPAGLGSPVSKGWFYTQFKAEAITYEIGDRTSRDSIQLMGEIAGEEMMNVFLANKDNF